MIKKAAGKPGRLFYCEQTEDYEVKPEGSAGKIA